MKKAGLTSLVLSLVLSASSAVAGGPTGNARRGKVVYERDCVSCHGELGNGNGESSQWITPKPRDYRQGIFKCQSTPSGTLPSPSDLERTVANGIYGTYMPAWYAIGERARHDVIAYIQTFSDRWKTEETHDPIPIPDQPPYTPESVQRGRAIYDQNGCAACHGEGGLGDGTSHGLVDEWGNPIVPTDLTSGHLKCGNTGEVIYRTLMVGMGGTPMPSFNGSMKPDEAWDLVHYIESLNPHYPKKATLR
jgi:cytochrome c oxidase cbb3-type subunit I/II